MHRPGFLRSGSGSGLHCPPLFEVVRLPPVLVLDCTVLPCSRLCGYHRFWFWTALSFPVRGCAVTTGSGSGLHCPPLFEVVRLPPVLVLDCTVLPCSRLCSYHRFCFWTALSSPVRGCAVTTGSVSGLHCPPLFEVVQLPPVLDECRNKDAITQ